MGVCVTEMRMRVRVANAPRPPRAPPPAAAASPPVCVVVIVLVVVFWYVGQTGAGDSQSIDPSGHSQSASAVDRARLARTQQQSTNPTQPANRSTDTVRHTWRGLRTSSSEPKCSRSPIFGVVAAAAFGCRCCVRRRRPFSPAATDDRPNEMS